MLRMRKAICAALALILLASCSKTDPVYDGLYRYYGEELGIDEDGEYFADMLVVPGLYQMWKLRGRSDTELPDGEEAGVYLVPEADSYPVGTEEIKATLKSDSDKTYTWGEWEEGFTIEKNLDGEWYIVNAGMGFNAMAYFIHPGEEHMVEMDISKLGSRYNPSTIDAGEYRIWKAVSTITDKGKTEYFVGFNFEVE